MKSVLDKERTNEAVEPARQVTKRATSGASFEQHRRSAAATNRKFYMVGAVLLIAAVTLGFVAMQGSAVYYVTVNDFKNKQAALTEGNKELRVAGVVVPGSITRDEVTRKIRFTAADKENPSQTIQVTYSKIAPDTFKDEAEVVVTGTYKNGVFSADEMLAKCPSKYSSTAE